MCDCCLSECVYVLKDILSPGMLWMCLSLTQGSRKGNGAWLYFDTVEFYFSFVRSLHPPLKAKQSPRRLHKYCDWQLQGCCCPFPFPTIAERLREAQQSSMVVTLVFERWPCNSRTKNGDRKKNKKPSQSFLERSWGAFDRKRRLFLLDSQVVVLCSWVSGNPVQGGTLGTFTWALPYSLLLDEQNIPEVWLGDRKRSALSISLQSLT